MVSGLRLPAPIGWAARRIRDWIDPFSVLLFRLADGHEVARVPPRRLRARVGAPGVRAFIASGHQAAGELADALARAGYSLPFFSSVLDFGSGSGRVLPHLLSRAGEASGTGCDVDAAAIDWARGNHPGISWEVNSFSPPLRFADRSFDLVYSISVLSHLNERLQDRWLAEISRVLRPRGVALLSIHGSHAFDQFRLGQARTSWCDPAAFRRGPLRSGEFAFVPYRQSMWNRSELPGVAGAFGLAFHDADYVRQRWGPLLPVVDVLPRAMTAWQDIVVCEKPPSQ